MIDAKRLLDQFMGTPGQGMGGYGQTYGQVPQQQQQQQGGLSGGLGSMLGGGLGGGAVAGGLAALFLGSKQGRRVAGTALQYGGMAVVGALAYRAYQNWQSGKSVQQSTVAANPTNLLPAPADTPFAPAAEQDQQSLGRHLLRAMISAAKADGQVDANEQANIFAEMDKLTLSAADKAFVMDELRKPMDIDAVARSARTPEEAASIYTASLLAIDVDNASERGYLGMLAARLNLDEALVKHLHATVEGATEPVPTAATAG